MKKIFMSIYILILAFFSYQMLLGKNGLIEGYRLVRENIALERYIIYLRIENEKLDRQLYELRNDSSAFEDLTHKMGYFKEDVELYKIIREDDELKINISRNDLYLMEYIESTIRSEELNKSRIYINIAFYFIITLFIFLIFLGGKRE